MADKSLQIDYYGRIVNISSEDLITGMNSSTKVISGGTDSAGKLAKEAENSHDKRQKLNEATKSLKDTFLDPDTVKDVSNYLEKMVALLEEINEKKETYRQNKKEEQSTPNFSDLSGLKDVLSKQTTAEDSVWDDGRAKALDKFLYEGTHGRSLHVHDYTSATILADISRDIKHIGTLIQNVVGDTTTAFGSFSDFNFKMPTPEGGARRGPSRATSDSPTDSVRYMAEESRGFFSSLTSKIKGWFGASPTITPDAGTVIPNAGVTRNVGTVIPDAGSITPDAGSAGSFWSRLFGKKTPAAPVNPAMDDSSLCETGDGLCKTGDDFTDILEETVKTMKNYRRSLGFNVKDIEKMSAAVRVAAERARQTGGMEGLNEAALHDITVRLQGLHKLTREDKLAFIDSFRKLSDIVNKRGYDPGSQVAVQAAEQIGRAAQRLSARDEKFLYRLQNSLQRFSSNLNTVLSALEPANFGIGTSLDLFGRLRQMRDETVQWNKDIHGTLFQNYGMRGSLMTDISGNPNPAFRRGPSEMRGFFEEANRLAADYNITGQSTADIQAVLIRNLQRGITLQSRWSALSRQGLQLGKLIGVSAEHTNEELADWHLHMGLSVSQTGQLARDMLSVSKITGLTGDRLLEAAKSGKQLADAMRSAGTLTSEASRHLIQFSAAAQRRGTDSIVRPLVEAMTDVNQLFEGDSGRFAFLARAAQAGGGADLMQALQEGTIMQNREMGQQMARGMRDVLNQLTGGRRVEQLGATERRNLNIISRSYGFRGINDMQMAADTFAETFMTSADRLRDINARLARTDLTVRERQDLNRQQAALERAQIGENMNEATRRLSEITRYTSTMSLDQAAARAGNVNIPESLRQVIRGLEEARNNAAGPNAADQRANLNREIARFRQVLDTGRSGEMALNTTAGMNNLVSEIDRVLNENNINERMFQMDQATFQAENQERFQRQLFEGHVRQALQHFMAWAPANLSLYNVHFAIAKGVVEIVNKLVDIILAIGAIGVAIWGLSSLLGILRGIPNLLNFLGGGRGVPGVPVPGAPGAPGAPGFWTTPRQVPAWLRGAGRMLPIAGGITGYLQEGPIGILPGVFTGTSNPNTGVFGLDLPDIPGLGRHSTNDASTMVYAALMGASFAGPVGAAIGVIVAAGIRIGRVLEQTAESISRTNRIVQNATNAHAAAGRRWATPEGRIEAHQAMSEMTEEQRRRNAATLYIEMAGNLRRRRELHDLVAGIDALRRRGLVGPNYRAEERNSAAREIARLDAQFGEMQTRQTAYTEARRYFTMPAQEALGDLAQNDLTTALQNISLPSRITNADDIQFLRRNVIRHLMGVTTPEESARVLLHLSREELNNIDRAIGTQVNNITPLLMLQLRRMPEFSNLSNDTLSNIVRTIVSRLIENNFNNPRGIINDVLTQARRDIAAINNPQPTPPAGGPATPPAGGPATPAPPAGGPATPTPPAGGPATPAPPAGGPATPTPAPGAGGPATPTPPAGGPATPGTTPRPAAPAPPAGGPATPTPTPTPAPPAGGPATPPAGGPATPGTTPRPAAPASGFTIPSVSVGTATINQAIIHSLVLGGAGTPGASGATPNIPGVPPAAGTPGGGAGLPGVPPAAGTPGGGAGLPGLPTSPSGINSWIAWLRRLSGVPTLPTPNMPTPESYTPPTFSTTPEQSPGAIRHVERIGPQITDQMLRRLNITRNQMQTMPTTELYRRIQQAQDPAMRNIATQLEGMLNPTDMISHVDLWNSLNENARDSIRRQLVPPTANEDQGAWRRRADSHITGMSTAQLTQQLRRMNTTNFGPDIERSVLGFRRQVEERNTRNTTRPSTGGAPGSGTGGPGGTTTPGIRFSPNAGGNMGNTRGPNFFYNVNRVESMIWDYVPTLDPLRTHQIAIAVTDEYMRAISSGNFTGNTLREIIERHLRAANVVMPTIPAQAMNALNGISSAFGGAQIRPTAPVASGTPSPTGTGSTVPAQAMNAANAISSAFGGATFGPATTGTGSTVPAQAMNAANAISSAFGGATFGPAPAGTPSTTGTPTNGTWLDRIINNVLPSSTIPTLTNIWNALFGSSTPSPTVSPAAPPQQTGPLQPPNMPPGGWPSGTGPHVPAAPNVQVMGAFDVDYEAIYEDFFASISWDSIVPQLVDTIAGLFPVSNLATSVSEPTTQQASSSSTAGLEELIQNKYMQQIASVEVTGPISTATNHLDKIEQNTRKTAEETREVKEEIRRLISLIGHGTSMPVDTSAKQKAASPPNYWDWAIPLTSPNIGAVRHTGIT